MTTIEENHQYRKQAEIFERLYPRVDDLMERFGRPDFLPGRSQGDYAVHGDFSGYPQVVVFIHNLELLRPNVVSELQHLIKEFPDWEIEVTVSVRNHPDDWPKMGLYVRPHEIIDGLQRQYLPKEYQDVEYDGARRGTAYDS